MESNQIKTYLVIAVVAAIIYYLYCYEDKPVEPFITNNMRRRVKFMQTGGAGFRQTGGAGFRQTGGAEMEAEPGSLSHQVDSYIQSEANQGKMDDSAAAGQGSVLSGEMESMTPMATSPQMADSLTEDGNIMATSEDRMVDNAMAMGRRSGMCQSDSDCNIVFGGGSNRCVDGACQCRQGKGTFCHMRPNYYKNPKDMSPEQVIKFKNNAELEKMTINDYVNWLKLFTFDEDNLPVRHRDNFNRIRQGQPVYDIPLKDPVEEFFATKAAKRDRVCLEIPNSEIDTPLNWKINRQSQTAGSMIGGSTNKPLSYSVHYKNEEDNKKPMMERNNNHTLKEWFMNNVNWMFYDVDRNAEWRVNDPNQNRFMNIVQDKKVAPRSSYQGLRLRNDPAALGGKVDPDGVSSVSDKEIQGTDFDLLA